MTTHATRRTACTALFLTVCLAACAPTAPRSDAASAAPHAAHPPVAAPPQDAPAPPRRGEADIRFMQGMVPHHAQALDMTALVADRTTNRSLRLIAERIEVSQRDEIAWMTGWLRAHGADAPDAHDHTAHAGHDTLMPGMLTADDFARLAAATGPAFDRLFFQFMIRHHQGALVMVTELLATPGAAQEADVYRFVSDVEADQEMEIERMRALLDVPPLPAPHSH